MERTKAGETHLGTHCCASRESMSTYTTCWNKKMGGFRVTSSIHGLMVCTKHPCKWTSPVHMLVLCRPRFYIYPSCMLEPEGGRFPGDTKPPQAREGTQSTKGGGPHFSACWCCAGGESMTIHSVCWAHAGVCGPCESTST